MLFKNMEIHGVGELITDKETGAVKWLRVPENVYNAIESEQGKTMCIGGTGVELRFVMESDEVTLRMRATGTRSVFHVYRGSIQGGWEDHEVNKIARGEYDDFVIKKSQNLPVLKRMTEDFQEPFSPEVIRVILDLGALEILDVTGNIRPPKKEELPQKTLLTYGSSITHGSNSIDASHSWASVVAHNLKVDVRNLGMAGSCRMEPDVIEYIASEGEKGNWDLATLELGINVITWEEDQIIERVENTIKQIAGRNPEKAIYVISPFYCNDDYNNDGIEANKWRRLIPQVVKELNYPNVTYIDGLDLLGDMSLISADEVHPNIYGVAQIAERLTKIIKG